MSDILPPDNALAVINDKNITTFFAEKGLDPILGKIKEEVAKFKGDISSEEGRKEIASFAFKLAKMKTQTDKLGKDLVSGMKAQTKIIDAERARAWDEIEALQHQVRKPLTEWEEKEEQRITGHKAALSTIETLALFTSVPTIHEIEHRMGQLTPYSTRAWQEFEQLATDAQRNALSALEARLTVARKAEEDRIELERLKKAEAERLQKERDDKIAAEAADKARREAEAEASRKATEEATRQRLENERIERERKEADERAEREKNARIASENKAAAEQKAAREKHERDKEKAVQDERDRAAAAKKAEDDATAKREANKRHRAKINNEALAALKILIGDDHAKAAVEAIARGNVPNVTINY